MRATRRIASSRSTGSNSSPLRQSPPNRNQLTNDPWALATVANTASGGSRSSAVRTAGWASSSGRGGMRAIAATLQTRAGTGPIAGTAAGSRRDKVVPMLPRPARR